MPLLGTYLVAGAGLTPEERLRIIRDAGFDFVCLNMDQLLLGEEVGITPAMCERVGIPFDNVHLTGKGTHAVWAEGERGDEITARYCKEIALCKEYGIKVGITHVTWGVSEPPPVGPVGLRRFEQITECAEKNGVILALENSVSAEHLVYVFDHIDSKALGFCLDTGHRNAFAPDVDFLSLYGDRLVATHIQDNDGRHDLHLFPFDGTVDWTAMAAALAKNAFAKTRICCEVSGKKRRAFPGMTAEEIREHLSRVEAVKAGLCAFEDGYFYPYVGMSYEDRIGRLYGAMQRLGRMIDEG